MAQIKNKNDDGILAKETYALIGAAMTVHKTLGCGFLEAVYQEALEIELKKCRIPFLPQQELQILYKGQPLKKTYVADFVAYDQVIIEIKAIDEITDREIAQLINYLHATQMPLGLLINFGTEQMTWKRKILSKYLRLPIVSLSA